MQVRSTNGTISGKCNFIYGLTQLAHLRVSFQNLGQYNISSWDDINSWWYRWLQVMKRLSHCSDNNWCWQVGLFSRLFGPSTTWVHWSSLPSKPLKGGELQCSSFKGLTGDIIWWDQNFPKNVNLGYFTACDGIDWSSMPTESIHTTLQSCWLLKITFFQLRDDHLMAKIRDLEFFFFSIFGVLRILITISSLFYKSLKTQGPILLIVIKTLPLGS